MNIIKKLLDEIFQERLMKSNLFEMAYEKKKAMELITKYQITIAEHFIKILVYNCILTLGVTHVRSRI
jgi:hypothetical protein